MDGTGPGATPFPDRGGLVQFKGVLRRLAWRPSQIRRAAWRKDGGRGFTGWNVGGLGHDMLHLRKGWGAGQESGIYWKRDCDVFHVPDTRTARAEVAVVGGRAAAEGFAAAIDATPGRSSPANGGVVHKALRFGCRTATIPAMRYLKGAVETAGLSDNGFHEFAPPASGQKGLNMGRIAEQRQKCQPPHGTRRQGD